MIGIDQSVRSNPAAEGGWPLNRAQSRALLLAIALIAALSTQSLRLFTSNQQTYLAHAVAATNPNSGLKHDWLVNTVDPVPVFSWLVRPLLLVGHWPLIVANLCIGTLFLVALGQIVAQVSSATQGRPQCGSIAVRCTTLVAVLWSVVPGPIRTFVFDGIADQRAYSNYLQPSNAGVLLVAAAWMAMRRRPVIAVGASTLAVWIHPTYANSWFIFAAGLCVAESDSRIRRTLWLSTAIALLLVLMPIVWSAIAFAPTGRDLSERAAQVLVFERLPHHALPSNWAGWRTACHVSLGMMAIFLLRGRERWMVVTWSSLTAIGIAIVMFSGRTGLMLLFPWRTTVWLLPVCAAICIGRSVRRAGERAEAIARTAPNWWVVCGTLAVLVTCISHLLSSRTNSSDDYKGVGLARALPARERQRKTILVPLDWEGVRLNALIAVYVDFKSHPYKDTEVLEWGRRVAGVRTVYENGGNCDALSTLLGIESDVAFVLSPRSVSFRSCQQTRAIYSDAEGVLYRVHRH